MDTAIRVTKLGKRVRLPESELCILEDVSFSLNRGETAAIIGASGSGKSTLLSLMAGLDTPSEGDVDILGTALNALDEDGRAKLRGASVGFVFQNFQLLPALTALENVMLPLELSGHADPETTARDILGKVGLAERLQHYPRQLSGGEQQRVAIARAFVVNPAVLFADEPTGNLDTDTGRAIADLLFELNATRGTTLVLVTHDRYVLDQVTRRIVEVDRGEARSYSGNYAYYLERKAEQEAAASASEAKARSVLRRELEWLKRGPKARSTKQKGASSCHAHHPEFSAPARAG